MPPASQVPCSARHLSFFRFVDFCFLIFVCVYMFSFFVFCFFDFLYSFFVFCSSFFAVGFFRFFFSFPDSRLFFCSFARSFVLGCVFFRSRVLCCFLFSLLPLCVCLCLLFAVHGVRVQRDFRIIFAVVGGATFYEMNGGAHERERGERPFLPTPLSACPRFRLVLPWLGCWRSPSWPRRTEWLEGDQWRR